MDTYLKRYLISPITIKRGEVDSANFLAKVGRQLHDASCIVQEGPGVRMRQGAAARIDVIEWCQRRVVLFAWKRREKMGVSVRLFLVLGGLVRCAEVDRAGEDLGNCFDSGRHGDAGTSQLDCVRYPLLRPHKYERGLASFRSECAQLRSVDSYLVSKSGSEFRKMAM